MAREVAKQKFYYFTHPLTLLLLLLLLVNHLILTPYLPSFVSGKLSDFALAYLLPLIFIAFGSLLPSIRLQKIIPWLGLGITIFLFGFGKIFAPVNVLIFQLLSEFLPFNTHFVLDPTDAFALVMLIPSFLVWKRTKEDKAVPTSKWKWIFLPAVMLITLADAAAPNYGITCLEVQSNGVLLAETAYYGEPYQSKDGGITWQPAESDLQMTEACELNLDYQDRELIFTSSSGLMVKFEKNTQILESLDSGKTWQTVHEIVQSSQAESAFRMRVTSSIDLLPGPFDLVEDASTGNLIAAMGQNGVLVRSADGIWQPSAVNQYRPVSPLKENGVASYFFLLWVEWIMCIVQAIFLVSLFNLRWRRSWWRIAKVGLAWLGWTLILIMTPAIADSYLRSFIQGIGTPVAVLWALICLVDDINSWHKPPTQIWKRFFPLAMIASVLNAIIYFFWAINFIPSYTVALGFVIGLTLIFAIIGTIWSGALRHQEE